MSSSLQSARELALFPLGRLTPAHTVHHRSRAADEDHIALRGGREVLSNHVLRDVPWGQRMRVLELCIEPMNIPLQGVDIVKINGSFEEEGGEPMNIPLQGGYTLK